MSDRKLIVSVLGFDLTCNIVDEHNQLIKRGIGSTAYKFKGGPNLNNRVINKAYWTNYNEKLLNKILDYRRNND